MARGAGPRAGTGGAAAAGRVAHRVTPLPALLRPSAGALLSTLSRRPPGTAGGVLSTLSRPSPGAVRAVLWLSRARRATGVSVRSLASPACRVPPPRPLAAEPHRSGALPRASLIALGSLYDTSFCLPSWLERRRGWSPAALHGRAGRALAALRLSHRGAVIVAAACRAGLPGLPEPRRRCQSCTVLELGVRPGPVPLWLTVEPQRPRRAIPPPPGLTLARPPSREVPAQALLARPSWIERWSAAQEAAAYETPLLNVGTAAPRLPWPPRGPLRGREPRLVWLTACRGQLRLAHARAGYGGEVGVATVRTGTNFSAALCAGPHS